MKYITFLNKEKKIKTKVDKSLPRRSSPFCGYILRGYQQSLPGFQQSSKLTEVLRSRLALTRGECIILPSYTLKLLHVRAVDSHRQGRLLKALFVIQGLRTLSCQAHTAGAITTPQKGKPKLIKILLYNKTKELGRKL